MLVSLSFFSFLSRFSRLSLETPCTCLSHSRVFSLVLLLRSSLGKNATSDTRTKLFSPTAASFPLFLFFTFSREPNRWRFSFFFLQSALFEGVAPSHVASPVPIFFSRKELAMIRGETNIGWKFSFQEARFFFFVKRQRGKKTGARALKNGVCKSQIIIK